LRKTIADCGRSGKLVDPEVIRATITGVLSDALNGAAVVDFYYLQQLKRYLNATDFVVAVTMTHNCVEFLENTKLYQYLGMRVANAERD
jgi:hypothetical protein